MNRSVLFLATAIVAIAIIAVLFLSVLKKGRDGSTDDAPPSEVHPHSEIKPDKIRQSVDSALTLEDDHLDTPAEDDHLKVVDEEEEQFDRALKEFIESMSEEDKRAKPEGIDMEYWAYFVAAHYQQLKQNGDIEFYGKVVTEDGTPLPNIPVQVSIYTIETLAKAVEQNAPGSYENFEVITDDQGLFSIKNKFGVSLILNLYETSGFRFDEEVESGFNFAPEEAEAGRGPRHQADPANPVVFKIVKVKLKPGYSLDSLDLE